MPFDSSFHSSLRALLLARQFDKITLDKQVPALSGSKRLH